MGPRLPDDPATPDASSLPDSTVAGTASVTLPEEPSGFNRRFTLGVVNTSHLLNHMQGSIRAILLPMMMQEMGFSFFQLGLLTSMFQLASAGMQGTYGLISQFYRRSVLLGIGNIVIGLSSGALGLTQTYMQVAGSYMITGLGTSAQHPLGNSILAGAFRKARGRVLGAHNAAGNIGSLIGPLIVVALLSFLDWRAIWMVLAIPSVLMGFAYFFFRDSVGSSGGQVKSGSKVALKRYLECLRNREVMVVAAIQMVGAAGRGTDISQVFLVPFFMIWMGVGTDMAAILLVILQVGGVIGPIAMGTLSDRIGRKPTIFLILLLSTVSTITLLLHSQVTPVLVLNLLVYGTVVNSRESLTQSMISDAVPDTHADAAFSLYYFIGFISGPAWTGLTGYLVDAHGFGWAFIVVGLTYLNGIALIALLHPRKKLQTKRE